MSFVSEIDERLEPILYLIEEDPERGMAQLRSLAEEGHPGAIETLGLHLSFAGEDEAAMEFLLAAAGFGSGLAAWNLAMVANQRGDRQDVKRWIDRSAILGNEDAVDVQSLAYDVEAHLAKERGEDI
ncbi:hypothetical protein C3941_05330 [Kaistia algarum]|uniref:hypothetical protein n=1 Tax=Kaistia algarum TaxID=2083279 RepID=UPI000CE8C51A|nr:hypothetical protein [Kaistia algarum]MCX5515899.1 hypothetical protein [Kaistia algarum]PPE80738.1 hypothetical protein C3941_05330 [Kaistia algarum]